MPAKAARTAQEALPLPNEKFVLVVGTGTSTVVNARLEGTKEFLYDISPDGDGTVPLDLARIVGRPTYRTNAEHGGMPNDNTVAAAVDNLLATGKTSVLELLDEAAPARRSAVTRTVREMALKAAQTYEGKRGRALSASETRRLIEEVAAPPHRDEAQLPALLTLDRVPVAAGAQRAPSLSYCRATSSRGKGAGGSISSLCAAASPRHSPIRTSWACSATSGRMVPRRRWTAN